MGEALPEYQMGSGNSPLGWVLGNTRYDIAHANSNKIEYNLSLDNFNKFRSLCPTDEDVYKLSGLDLYTDNLQKIEVKEKGEGIIQFFLCFNNGLEMSYHIDITHRICTARSLHKKPHDKEHYKSLISSQLENMKYMGIKSIDIHAYKDDATSYGYNIRPLYGYDVMGSHRKSLIISLEFLYNRKNLSFEGKYTDARIKRELQKFLTPYKSKNPPALLLPYLFENPILRNMWRQIGRSFFATMVLEDGHPTWEYLKTKFRTNGDI